MLGEIILIVVGIMIALRINNWNEENKAAKFLDNSLSALILNLEDDIKDLTSIMVFYSEVIEDIDYGLKIINVPRTYRPPTSTIMDSLFMIGLEVEFISTRTAFQSMEAGGDFQSLEDQELLRAIYGYYNLVEKAENSNRKNNLMVSDLLEPYIYSKFELRKISSFSEWVPDPNRASDIELPLDDVQFENLLLVRRFRSLSDSNRFSNVADTARELKGQIEMYLEELDKLE